MTIEWNKIVTNAISALVVTVFLGAATIVWKGATSVDVKVQANRDDMTHLIDTLSDKLGSYEVQLTSFSNQLNVIVAQSKSLRPPTGINLEVPQMPLTGMPAPTVKPPAPDNSQQMIQQKAYSQDINKLLKR